jgi:hypothetical protein
VTIANPQKIHIRFFLAEEPVFSDNPSRLPGREIHFVRNTMLLTVS